MSTKVHDVIISKFSSTDGWDDMYEDHKEYEEELEQAKRGK